MAPQFLAALERGLSSLSCVCVYVDQNKAPTPIKEILMTTDSTWPKRPTLSQNFMGANHNITPPLLKEIFMTTDFTWPKILPPMLKFHRCIPSRYTFPATGNPDTTKTTCYRIAAQCWKAFLVHKRGMGKAPSHQRSSFARFNLSWSICCFKFWSKWATLVLRSHTVIFIPYHILVSILLCSCVPVVVAGYWNSWYGCLATIVTGNNSWFNPGKYSVINRIVYW